MAAKYWGGETLIQGASDITAIVDFYFGFMLFLIEK
jgi:hypothetical protein